MECILRNFFRKVGVGDKPQGVDFDLVKAEACALFEDLIDAAKDNEVDLLAYGGAIAVAAAVGFISKNLKFTKAAFIAACAAAGITVTSDVAGIAGEYVNNILNSRDEYFAVQGFMS